MKVGTWIKRHAKQLTRMLKRFLSTFFSDLDMEPAEYYEATTFDDNSIEGDQKYIFYEVSV